MCELKLNIRMSIDGFVYGPDHDGFVYGPEHKENSR
jgi:hypothetical protein